MQVATICARPSSGRLRVSLTGASGIASRNCISPAQSSATQSTMTKIQKMLAIQYATVLRKAQGEPLPPLWKRVAWFAGLAITGALSTAAIAYALRLLLR